jgi:ribosome-binding protein aMBF1 (putative translation factor)
MHISPSLCRCARALLGISTSELASQVGISGTVVRYYETLRTGMSLSRRENIKRFFNNRGIYFVYTVGERSAIGVTWSHFDALRQKRQSETNICSGHETTNSDIVHGTICRASRALLGWSLEILAIHSGLHIQTIRRFERGEEVELPAKKKILTTLTSSGISLPADEDGKPELKIFHTNEALQDLIMLANRTGTKNFKLIIAKEYLLRFWSDTVHVCRNVYGLSYALPRYAENALIELSEVISEEIHQRKMQIEFEIVANHLCDVCNYIISWRNSDYCDAHLHNKPSNNDVGIGKSKEISIFGARGAHPFELPMRASSAMTPPKYFSPPPEEYIFKSTSLLQEDFCDSQNVRLYTPISFDTLVLFLRSVHFENLHPMLLDAADSAGIRRSLLFCVQMSKILYLQRMLSLSDTQVSRIIREGLPITHFLGVLRGEGAPSPEMIAAYREALVAARIDGRTLFDILLSRINEELHTREVKGIPGFG